MTEAADATGREGRSEPVSPDQVKEALDEARTLVLGVQVLLGFQYAALFQTAFAKLPLAVRQLDAAAMGLMLVTLVLLLGVVPYHRIAARAGDTGPVLAYCRQRIAQALLPFALAIGLDIALVGMPTGGMALAIGGGVAASLLALLFWYGTLWLRPRGASPAKPSPGSQATMIVAQPPSTPTPLPKKIEQMLTETRVVLPGVQALLGFQFSAVLTDAFLQLPPSLRLLHFASLGLMALAMILLMAVPAYHRIVASGEDRPDVERFGTAMVLASLAPLALALAADFYILLLRVEVPQGAALALALLTVAACAALWLVYPLLARR
jgi:hypothetical protein